MKKPGVRRASPKKNIDTRSFGAFDQGTVPVIACFNKAKTPLDVDFDKLIAALQTYIDKHVAPVWGTPAKLIKSKGFVKGAWALALLDDVDKPGVIAYHDLTPDGLPMSKAFVRTCAVNGTPLSVSISHELAEMLVDPGINMMARGAGPEVIYAYEASDPVEDTHFDVRGLPMSNFVYPAYFEYFRKPRSTKFDHLGLVKKPLQMLPGGYQLVIRNGKWDTLYASEKKKAKHDTQDRRGRRGAARHHSHEDPLKRSHKIKTLVPAKAGKLA